MPHVLDWHNKTFAFTFKDSSASLTACGRKGFFLVFFSVTDKKEIVKIKGSSFLY